MLKIVYSICCGIDVHKTFVVASIATSDRENITTYQTKRFSTFTQDLRALALWLSNNVCIESTANIGFPFSISWNHPAKPWHNPKYVKAIRGKKTDKKDSIWIEDLHKHDLVFPSSFIPPADIREIFRFTPSSPIDKLLDMTESNYPPYLAIIKYYCTYTL